MKVGFIGLGNIGMPMAKTLLKAGFTLTVHNRSRGKVDEMVTLGAEQAWSPKEIAGATDIVLTCLPDVPTVEEIFLGEEGVVRNARPGQILVDHSTIGPSTARKIAKAADSIGAFFLDAPLGGGSAQAAVEGTLTIMVGGDRRAYERALPVFQAMGSTIPYMGPAGAGSTMKLVSNLMAGINSVGVAEAFLLARRLGLNPQVFLDTAATNAGRSFMLSYLGPIMAGGDFTRPVDTLRPALRLITKDLELITDAAQEAGVPLLAGAQALRVFQEASSLGMGEDDLASILRVLEELADKPT